MKTNSTQILFMCYFSFSTISYFLTLSCLQYGTLSRDSFHNQPVYVQLYMSRKSGKAQVT